MYIKYLKKINTGIQNRVNNLLLNPRVITLIEPYLREILLGIYPYSYVNKGVTSQQHIALTNITI